MMFFISSGKLLGSDNISVDVHKFRNAFKATEKIQLPQIKLNIIRFELNMYIYMYVCMYFNFFKFNF